MPVTNRATDEIHLAVLARAASGESMAEISAGYGKTEAFARMIIARARSADLAESGEPAAVVARSYPKARAYGRA